MVRLSYLLGCRDQQLTTKRMQQHRHWFYRYVAPYTFKVNVRKPKKLSAWVTAIVMIIAVAAISEIFVYIPSATLGAVIIVSASSLFKSEEWKRFWKYYSRENNS